MEEKAKTTVNRIKALDYLLFILDLPKDNDEVIFTVEGDDTKYRGILKKEFLDDKKIRMKIVSLTLPMPTAKITSVRFRDNIINVNGNTFGIKKPV